MPEEESKVIRTENEAYAARQNIIEEVNALREDLRISTSPDVLRKCLDVWEDAHDSSLFAYGPGGALISALPVAEAVKGVMKEALITRQFGIKITQEEVESGGVLG
jgi:hypothetical protein